MTIVWNHQSLLNSPAGRHQDPKGNRLILKVSAVKNRVWVWQARVGGVPRQITIGDFPAIGLAETLIVSLAGVRSGSFASLRSAMIIAP